MGSPRWSRALAASVGAALLAAGCGAGGGGDGDGEDGSLQGVRRDPPLEVAQVTLPDATAGGEEFTTTAGDGGLLLVYFGYTSCPDICPTTMSDLARAIEELPAHLARRVEVAMVTVDPERDTAEVLDGYLAHFFEDTRRHALRTDDTGRLEAAKRAFGVRAQVEAHDPGDDDYDVSHTAVTYAVDDSGRVVVEWPFGTTPDAIRSDLETLLEEADR
ncbi:MAG: electron transporter SenC [Acidimicrobiia bacterium]|nr:MAG: electron transporter SenC [Acidimicrobiia bacterium]